MLLNDLIINLGSNTLTGKKIFFFETSMRYVYDIKPSIKNKVNINGT